MVVIEEVDPIIPYPAVKAPFPVNLVSTSIFQEDSCFSVPQCQFDWENGRDVFRV